jgi:hypothetical protein
MSYRVAGSFVLLTFSFSVAAQPASSSLRPVYFNSIEVGGLLAKKGDGTSLAASMIHGLRIKNLSVGLGIGYDAYPEWRTLPVFGSVGYDFARVKKNKLFLQLNGGRSKNWNPQPDDSAFIYADEGGWIVHPVVGYRISSESFSLYLTAGYKFQKIQYGQSNRWWNNNGIKTTVERNIERISIQLGFGFR